MVARNASSGSKTPKGTEYRAVMSASGDTVTLPKHPLPPAAEPATVAIAPLAAGPDEAMGEAPEEVFDASLMALHAAGQVLTTLRASDDMVELALTQPATTCPTLAICSLDALLFLEPLRGDDGEMITELRTSDGFVNATKMCQGVGKKFSKFLATSKTKRFLIKLAEELGTSTPLVDVTRGGAHSGSFVHPRVLTWLACWCDIGFAVHVTKWVEQAKESVTRVHDEYWKAISELKYEPSSEQIERDVRVRLAVELGGTQCFIGVLGEIDLVTDDQVIEIKWVCRALHAVGQVLGHSRSFPEKGRRIHLFGDADEFSRTNMSELRSMCSSLDISVTVELLESTAPDTEIDDSM